MPSLPGEGALQEEVAHRLGSLVAEWASWLMLETASSQAVGRPAPVLAGQPVKKLHSWRRPILPYELPREASHGSLEGGKIA